jgi:hypothetical protein
MDVGRFVQAVYPTPGASAFLNCGPSTRRAVRLARATDAAAKLHEVGVERDPRESANSKRSLIRTRALDDGTLDGRAGVEVRHRFISRGTSG